MRPKSLDLRREHRINIRLILILALLFRSEQSRIMGCQSRVESNPLLRSQIARRGDFKIPRISLFYPMTPRPIKTVGNYASLGSRNIETVPRTDESCPINGLKRKSSEERRVG